jgi:hypothetical protein
MTASLQHAAGISAGGSAALDIEVTKGWPEPSVPEDLATALAAAPQRIQDQWNEITPMARWEWVRAAPSFQRGKGILPSRAALTQPDTEPLQPFPSRKALRLPEDKSGAPDQPSNVVRQ